jgi:voltage-gated potassium channel
MFSISKDRIYEIIFEADTKEGKLFDVILIIVILLSLLVVLLESISELKTEYGQWFFILEWVFTGLFLVEYGLRIYSTRKPSKYIFSFFGIIDFLSILPAFLGLIFAGTQTLIIIRSIRLLRVFRVLKLVDMMVESMLLWQALKASRRKILVFLSFLVIHTMIFGSVLYILESSVNSGFDTIPRSIYWAIVTLTTVGYGDISPITPMGQFIASLVMISGYAVIAVPTGIITSEMMKTQISEVEQKLNTRVCKDCVQTGHDNDAKFCKFCGQTLVVQTE